MTHLKAVIANNLRIWMLLCLLPSAQMSTFAALQTECHSKGHFKIDSGK